MTTQIIIRFKPNQLFDWQWLTAQNEVLAAASQQAVLQIPGDLTSATVILVVPSTEVTLLQVKFPRTKRSALRQALPYAIEEKLCEDVETLHFASGAWQKINGVDHLTVAVTSHDNMATWLRLCASAKLTPQYIIPDIFALPYVSEQWHCSLEDDLLLLRTGQQSGMVIDHANAKLVLTILLAQQPPVAISVATAVPTALTELFPTTATPLKIMAHPQSFLSNTVINLSQAINLRQGQYRAATRLLP